VAVEGWRPVEDVVRWGFAQAPVVMANEAHDGLARSVRTRVVGARMIRAAHEVGVRRLAMEALGWPERDVPGPITALPDDSYGGYLAQPEMRAMIGTALDLGWTLWAYEAQAVNLGRLTETALGEPLLVWCGNGHATKEKVQDWVPMGWHFREMSSTDPFVIDQTVTVAFSGELPSRVPELLASLAGPLAAYGGTAAILREQAPPALDWHTGIDAMVVSTDNELTEDTSTEDGA
jgi:hypothetical protein